VDAPATPRADHGLSTRADEPSEPSLSTDDDEEDDDEIDDFLREAAQIPATSRPTDPDRSGETLGHYRLEAKIGEGGMGVVYAARETKLGRSVAIKLLPRALVGDPSRRKRLLREARAAAAISHPAIATIYEAGEIDGDVYLAMEKLEGRTLRALVDDAAEGRLPIQEALRIARAIAGGLGEAHDKGVVHRDVKPENVMIVDGGAVKILDFGLAKLSRAAFEAGESTLATRAGGLLGTPSYMSPEQAKGHAVGPPGDVFALGIVLYEMLTGKRPFVGVSAPEVFIAIDRDDPLPPSRSNPRVAKALDRLVMRCLAKDPARRFANGRELAQAIAAIESGTGRPSIVTPARLVFAIVLAFAGVGAWLLMSPPDVALIAPLSPTERLQLSTTSRSRDMTLRVSASLSSAPPSAASVSAIASASTSAVSRLPVPSVTRPPKTSAIAVDPLARQK